MKKFDYEIANELADKFDQENDPNLTTLQKSAFIRCMGEQFLRDEFLNIKDYRKMLLDSTRIFDDMKLNNDLDPYEWFCANIGLISASKLKNSEIRHYLVASLFQTFSIMGIAWGAGKVAKCIECHTEEDMRRSGYDKSTDTVITMRYNPEIIN